MAYFHLHSFLAKPPLLAHIFQNHPLGHRAENIPLLIRFHEKVQVPVSERSRKLPKALHELVVLFFLMLLHRLQLFQSCRGGGFRKFVREQEVPGISVGDLPHLVYLPCASHLLKKNYFHSVYFISFLSTSIAFSSWESRPFSASSSLIVTSISGFRPSPSRILPLGSTHCATVRFTEEPSRNSSICCTVPLPNVFSPMSFTPRLSRSAPARISEAEAEPLLTTMTTGNFERAALPWAINSSLSPFLNTSFTTSVPRGTNHPARSTDTSRNPPGLLRRLSTIPLLPLSNVRSIAL